MVMKKNRCVVRCVNTGKEIVVVPGTTVKELLEYLPLEDKKKYISAYVNNKSKDLNYVIDDNLTVKYIDASHFEGSRVYRRTLIFMLWKAVHELYADVKLKVQFSVGVGAYFELEGVDNTKNLSSQIKKKIREYIDADIDIEREMMHIDDIIEVFTKTQQKDKLELMESLKHLYYVINTMGESKGYFYGTLAASTSQINLFNIEQFYNGYVIILPERTNPNELEESPKNRKMYDVFADHKRWMKILDVATIGQLNKKIQEGNAPDLIKIGEALHEKQLSMLADKIADEYEKGVRVVLISGPSSSGKTTSSYRLSIQLRVLGLEPVIIGMDNYFVDRTRTPLDEKGRYDYECLEAIDVTFFNEQINELIGGKEVDIPSYDFVSGTRKFIDNKLKLKSNSIIVIEGIHALNPKATESISRDKMYKLYVSAMTSLSMDNTSYISTTDNRLIRRIVRDYQFRGCSALDTIKRWGSVRTGEEKYIFPYQSEADYQFNSALFFEIGVLKPYVEPLLRDVPPNAEEYSEASRLLTMLDYFTPIPTDIVPSTSLLKEFTGGSGFNIK